MILLGIMNYIEPMKNNPGVANGYWVRFFEVGEKIKLIWVLDSPFTLKKKKDKKKRVTGKKTKKKNNTRMFESTK